MLNFNFPVGRVFPTISNSLHFLNIEKGNSGSKNSCSEKKTVLLLSFEYCKTIMKLYENIKIPDKDSLDGARTLPFEVR